MQKTIDNIPPEQMKEEIEKLRPQMEQRARRMREVPRVEEAMEFGRKYDIALAEMRESAK
jgi:hypothetical protein